MEEHASCEPVAGTPALGFIDKEAKLATFTLLQMVNHLHVFFAPAQLGIFQ